MQTSNLSLTFLQRIPPNKKKVEPSFRTVINSLFINLNFISIVISILLVMPCIFVPAVEKAEKTVLRT